MVYLKELYGETEKCHRNLTQNMWFLAYIAAGHGKRSARTHFCVSILQRRSHDQMRDLHLWGGRGAVLQSAAEVAVPCSFSIKNACVLQISYSVFCFLHIFVTYIGLNVALNTKTIRKVCRIAV